MKENLLFEVWSLGKWKDSGSTADIESTAEHSQDVVPEKDVFVERGVRVTDKVHGL